MQRYNLMIIWWWVAPSRATGNGKSPRAYPQLENINVSKPEGARKGSFFKNPESVRGTGEGPLRNLGPQVEDWSWYQMSVQSSVCMPSSLLLLPPIGQMPSEDKEDEILKGYRPLRSGQGRSRRTRRLTLSLMSCDLTSLYLSFQKIIVS